MSPQTVYNYNKQYYLTIWAEMFRAFLGWSEAETLRWVERWKSPEGRDPLDDPEDIFYHETPQYWAAQTLIPAPLQARLSKRELLDLERRILLAFQDEHHYEFSPGTDWWPYREKVERILAEYGAALPAAR